MFANAVLLLACVALARSANHIKFSSGSNSWVTLPDATGYTAEGSVNVQQADGQVSVEATDLIVWKNGEPFNATYVAHVHALACDDNASGGHWKANTTIEGTVESNELWVGPHTQAGDVKWGEAAADTAITGFFTTANSPKSFTIHEVLSSGSPKRVCIDLAVAAALDESTTSTMMTSSTAAGQTTTATTGTGSTTAGGVTTTMAAPAPAGCAEAEDVTECCDKLNELEQDEDGDDVSKDACTQCILDSACKFYRNIGGSIAEIQTKCLPKDAEKPTVLTEVTDKDDCPVVVEGCAAITDCGECLDAEACSWCDTAAALGDKVGISASSGSCERECKTGVEPTLTCAAADSALNLAAAAVAALVFAARQ